MKGLTERQREIIEFLQTYAQDHRTWPSIRDIQFYFQYKSTNAVMGHLRALMKKGLLKRVPGQARTYEIVDEPTSFLPEGAMEVGEVPVIGQIAAGYPDRVESTGVIDSLQVDVHTIGRSPDRTFALRVTGDSMIDAGIEEGDTVLLELRPPRDRDIVAALIDGETTLKRYMHGGGKAPYLKAENVNYPNLIPAHELVIQGVAKAVIRSL